MGLIRSLSIGASSLKTHQKGFDVISNNLANANTVAYKSNSANFAEEFNQVYSYGRGPGDTGTSAAGGTNPLQYGLGVKLSSIQQNMTQGVVESTNRPLDMALQGDGFFVYNLGGTDYYSRAGAVSQDKFGNLVDSGTGAYLQGYNVSVDANGRTNKTSDGVNILEATVSNLTISPDVVSAPKQTESITLKGNLNSEAEEGNVRTTSIDILDNNGGAHTVTLTFTKSATDNQYDVTAKVDGTDISLDATNITFNPDGSLSTPLELNMTAADLNTAVGSDVFDATSPKDVTIKLADANNLLQGLTNFAQADSATATSQDGYKPGSLLSLSVQPDGRIVGSFSNGQAEVLGQVVVAKFTNEDGLVRSGNNFYQPSPNSGLPVIGTATETFASTMVAGQSLEQSNVDMTEEFTDMISTQRAFEAASRTISVSDQLLQEINQLKR